MAVVENVTDVYCWDKERKILTWKELGIPGLEMIGCNYEPKNNVALFPHVHRDCMEIVYVVSGMQTYCVGSQQYALQGNQFFITPANVPHSTGTFPHGRSKIYWLRLYKEYAPGFLHMDDWAGRALHQAIFALDSPVICSAASLRKPIAEVFSLLTEPGELNRVRACALLQDFLIQMCLGTPVKATISVEILQAMMYITEHIFETITLENLAGTTKLSISGLTQRFQRELGVSPREYINRMKIEKAKELLSDSESSVTEIAFALAFSSSNYFSFVFHKLTGKSPTEFRQDSRQKSAE